ncbi:MAG: DUF3892 domain-containing protein [Sphingopyxis sp.]|nr:DUF3892 domain-containing protein [Sphingopyxis sp.]
MTTYQITCIHRDGPDRDWRIDRIAGPLGSWSIDEAIALIKRGNRFWTSVQNRSVWIVIDKHPISGREYLRTEADGFPPNNLLSLKECPR